MSETVSLAHDTRDNKSNPSRGGYEKMSVGYYNSAGGPFEYFKYRADIARFIPVYKNRIVIALRASAEFNDSVGGSPMPFFGISRLGGYRTLPGFQHDRFYDNGRLFFNAEYRYNIWNWKDIGMEAVIGFSTGQVFHKIRTIQMRYFRNSYIVGLRPTYKGKVSFSAQVGFSDEGPEFYLKVGTPF